MMYEDRQMRCFSLCKAKTFCKTRRRAYLPNGKIQWRLSTLFSEVPSDRIRDSGCNLQPWKATIRSIRFNSFCVWLLGFFFPLPRGWSNTRRGYPERL